MRNIHLYLGVFFAPLLLFFVVTGCLQTFELHQGRKSGYKPAAVIKALSEAHMDQRFAYGDARPQPSVPFRYLVLLMSIGLLATTILGILMAFKYTRPWVVWACLSGGVAVPCFLLWMGYK